MTTAHPRDPRLRRHQGGGAFAPVDVAAAAVRLEVAADAMRAQQLERGPEQLAAAVAFGTTAEPLTAQQFAAALELPDEDLVAESPAPAPVVSLPPAPPAPAPYPTDARGRPIEDGVNGWVDPDPVFSSERGRALTWRSRHDPRSRQFGVRALLAGSAPLTDHVWPVGPVLDQGTEGACVGCAVADAANALELMDDARAGGDHDYPLDLEDATAVYKRAQQLDEVPGEAYAGTSVLAGMQAGVEAGLFGGYRWAFGTRDVAQAVLQVGPVVVGVPWLSGMYDTGPGGLVQLEGDDTGIGHCLAVVGIRLKGPQGQSGPFFVWQNSWGPDYGDGGLGYIHHRDLAELLHGTGEAAIPMPGPQHV